MKPRTRARGIALQALYEIDMTDHDPNNVIKDRLVENQIETDLANFMRRMVLEIIKVKTQLDKFIADHAPEWPLDQVATIDRNIIRLALWEMAIYKLTPSKVVINEAVELAKEFGSESSPRFVNGVLGSLLENKNQIQQSFEKFFNQK